MNLEKYVPVHQRVKMFRETYKNSSIRTSIENINDDSVLVKAEIRIDGELVATGHAFERTDFSEINTKSLIENCETSAVGRALGFFGIGIENGIASQDEIKNKKALDPKIPEELSATESQLNLIERLNNELFENLNESLTIQEASDILVDLVEIDKISEIEFIEENHTYLVNGIIFPSVSEIVQKFHPKNFKGIPQKILGNKRSFGEKIHKMIENSINSKSNFVLSDYSIDEADVFENFEEKTKNFILRVAEIPIFHHLRYAGRLDIYGKNKKTGKSAVLDIKNYANLSNLDVKRIKMQLSLYAYAYAWLSHQKYEDIETWLIWVRNDKQVKVIEYQKLTEQEIIELIEKFYGDIDKEK